MNSKMSRLPKDLLSADFTKVPVIDVHKDNLSVHLPGLLKAIEEASFVAIDCELSGLGDRKKLNAPSIDERYLNTCLVAKTRSIIALGLSTFVMENIPQGEN
jgi:target of EGR1 protein 1